MAYTVKQVAAMSGVSVRTLHFYDETGLLKPAYLGANGYRFYEEPQLLTLQQILFYRELGFELKQIKRILGRADFEKVAALQSHRKVLEKNLTRTRTLIETIDKTIKHLKGTKKMKSRGNVCRASASPPGKTDSTSTSNSAANRLIARCRQRTPMARCVFSSSLPDGRATCTTTRTSGSTSSMASWIWWLARSDLRLAPGESVFIPRKVAHVWGPVGDEPGKIINVYQPAGKIEEFFREVGNLKDLPTREDVINKTYTDEQISTLRRLFGAYGMELLPAAGLAGL